MVGKSIAHYEVLGKLGAGGMGVVYKARDTRLERHAAIKALPEELAEDPERLARFEREARLLGSLNNPNIATVYGLEEVEGRRFLAMELVEGESLAERLAKGPVPVEQALELARQIAGALEAAHAADVIHRDVKPGNIMLDKGGQAKVLDFGLAKALRADAPGEEQSALPGAVPSALPTLAQPMTQAGQLLGTPFYMSPEQVAGSEAGKQSDIWAFGCVLYELLTGKRAFASPIADQVQVESALGELPEGTVASARRLLRRCLQIDPRKRLHDIADARLELDEALAELERGEAVAARTPPEDGTPRWRSATTSALLAASVLAALVAGLLLGLVFAPRSESPTRRFEILTRDLQPVSAGGGGLIAISDDGMRIAYVDRSQLFVRDLSSSETRPVAGSDLGVEPFFSPDGEWLVYTAGATGVARKVWVAGGEPFDICPVRSAGLFGGTWEADRIVLSDGRSLRVVAADGSTCTLFGEEHRDPAHSYRDPQFLPGGEELLVELMERGEEGASMRSIARLSASSGRLLDVIVSDAGSPRYVETGHLTFLRGNTVLAVAFDPGSGRTVGDALPVIQEVDFSNQAHLDVSSEGTLVYVPAQALPELTLTWVDRRGNEEPLELEPASYWIPRISPEGDRLAVTVRRSGGGDLFLVEPGLSTPEPFARDALWPAWIPGRSKLAFASYRELPTGLFWKDLRGGAPAERIAPRTELGFYVLSASADPMVFTFYETRMQSGRDVLVMRPGEEPVTVVATEGEDKAPRLSFDARYLAYASDWSGEDQVYVRTCPECRPDLDLVEERWRLSTNGGTAPVWSRDGSEIFYLEGNRMMSVAVRTDPLFQHEAPESLFESDHVPDQFGNPNYDVGPDGRFIMVKGGGREASRHRIHVVVNWSGELEKRFAALR